VIIDLDKTRSAEHQELVKKYYQGSIPHVVVLDASGRAVYNDAGEVSESEISHILDRQLNGPAR
jgi:thioredoxin-related protein